MLTTFLSILSESDHKMNGQVSANEKNVGYTSSGSFCDYNNTSLTIQMLLNH